MKWDDYFVEGNERHLVELCQKCLSLEETLFPHGKKPEPFRMAQELGITNEEYVRLKDFIMGGEYNEMINNQISNDFQRGARNLE